MKDKIAFIINPISGVSNKKRIPPLIFRYLDMNKFEPTIVFTHYAGHATELAQGFIDSGFKCVVAVGGDGTVHEVAAALRDSDTALGIIPRGSGNGLARHLKVSLNIRKAIRQLNYSKVTSVDYCLMNGQPFFCTCGIGFDAYISSEFDKVKIRGFFGYLRKIITGFFKYKPQEYILTDDKGEEYCTKAFLITFANAAQWGFDAYIAPRASVKDGLFDITVIKKVHFFSSSILAIKLFTKSIGNSKHFKTHKAREIKIKSEDDMMFHLDGDPFGRGKEADIKIVSGGLKVFCARTFQ